MSKIRSGIFPTSHSNATLLRTLTNHAIRKMIETTPGGKKKSMACGAYDLATGEIATSFAGEPPSEIHPLLIDRADRIGGIGSHGLTDKNIVGVCAEFHVVNQLLLRGSKISDIRLTNSIRPKTGEIKPYCNNCKKMFADLIE